jgi:hypothetical protein
MPVRKSSKDLRCHTNGGEKCESPRAALARAGPSRAAVVPPSGSPHLRLPLPPRVGRPCTCAVPHQGVRLCAAAGTLPPLFLDGRKSVASTACATCECRGRLRPESDALREPAISRQAELLRTRHRRLHRCHQISGTSIATRCSAGSGFAASGIGIGVVCVHGARSGSLGIGCFSTRSGSSGLRPLYSS